MSVLAWILALLVLACAALIVLIVRARPQARAVLSSAPSWTNDAGQEFASLSEAERCDLVFAIAALDDPAAQRMLERALEDPSETVALAAASALARLDRRAVVEGYLAANRNERAVRIARTLELLSEA